MDKKKIQKKEKRRILLSILIMIVSTGIVIFSANQVQKNKKEQVAEANIQKVRQLAEVKVEDIEVQIQSLDAANGRNTVSVSETKQRSRAEIKKAFHNCIMIGDSIAEGANSYGLLDADMVISERGYSIEQSTELIERAAALSPKIIFMEFGMNDLEWFSYNPNAFAQAYRIKLEYLKTHLPNTKIYVNSVFPVRADKIAEKPFMGYYAQFNEALKNVCQEEKITFLDITSMLEGKDELYTKDGQHPVSSFYLLWLSYLEQCAGL